MTPVITRLLDAQIITPATDPSIGNNIQGPSLIKVPDWVSNPLGMYYLYFADHKGAYIRLAYADSLEGPWRVHRPGSLQLADSHFPTEPPKAPPGALEAIEERLTAGRNEKGGNETSAYWQALPHDLLKELTAPHIASPDVHVDETNQCIVMYYHGLSDFARQESRVALSDDGITFNALPEILGRTYMRAFKYGDYTYTLAMPGTFYRSKDGLTSFEVGPTLFNKDMRHNAVLVRDDELYIFWTQVNEAPERIYLTRISLTSDWKTWRESERVEVMRPEHNWEGADAPLEPSMRSVAYGHVNQLRDPAIFVEGDQTYLLYAVAGESGIAIAQLHFSESDK